MYTYDFVNTVILLVLLALAIVSYSVRMLIFGRAHFDRVDRQGSSVLLGKGLMEMAYWSFQPIARLLVFLGVTPNQLSWASLVLGGIAGTAFAYGYFGFGALFATYSALADALDGMVARMTEVSSDAGEVLDAAVDRYVEFFLLGGVVFFYRDNAMMFLVSLFALTGSFMISYSTAKAEALHIPPPPGIMRRPERAVYLILGAAISSFPFGEGSALFAELPGLPLAIVIFALAVLTNIGAIERLWTIGREVRERERIAAELAAQNEASQEILHHEENAGLVLREY